MMTMTTMMMVWHDDPAGVVVIRPDNSKHKHRCSG